MHKIKKRIPPSSLLKNLKTWAAFSSYPTRFLSGNCRKPQIKLRKCRFRISIKDVQQYGTTLWEVRKKKFNRLLFFKTKIKNKSPYFENEVTFSKYFAFENLLTEASTDGNDGF